MPKGIGYQEYKRQRMINEGLRSSDLERKGNERYSIYFGRAHCTDYQSGVESRGYCKIGRGKFTTALMRGRNQPGIDFRVYGEIILASDYATYRAEDLIKEALSHRHVGVMSQGQKELYNITDEELPSAIQTISETLISEGFQVNETNIFIDESV